MTATRPPARLDADVLVIGAGMAGASLAFELTRLGQRVVAIERESQPGYHTTGRSAALYTPLYGNATVRALSRASLGFFRSPPPGLAEHPLLTPRGALYYAADDEADAFTRFADETMAELAASAAVGQPLAPARVLRGDALAAAAPMLRTGGDPESSPGRDDGGDVRRLTAGLYDASAEDIDVHALLAGYWRLARAGGATLLTGRAIEDFAISRDGGGWRLVAADGLDIRAGTVANAAGAWADPVARAFGLPPLGIEPKRRTALIFEPSASEGRSSVPADTPLVISLAEDVYFKPDAGRVMLSLADETPSPPVDAQPEELDVAMAIDHLMRDTTLGIARVTARWAGLRSFARDRSPVAGHDPRAPGLFWLAGQGGYGIQMAPALARFAALQLLGRPVPADLQDQGFGAGQAGVERLL